jgi:hypothetical protein
LPLSQYFWIIRLLLISPQLLDFENGVIEMLQNHKGLAMGKGILADESIIRLGHALLSASIKHSVADTDICCVTKSLTAELCGGPCRSFTICMNNVI